MLTINRVAREARDEDGAGNQAGLVGEIATQLRDRIINGAIVPGARIMEARLARSFGTSRAPVREASRMLESEGLLVASANRGFSVREMTVGEFIELTEFRICIERYAISRVVQSRRRAEILQDLYALATRISALHGLRHGAARIISDIDFHLLIVRCADNKRMLTAYEQLLNDLQVAMHLMSVATDDAAELANGHTAIIEAIATGDPGIAEVAMEHHIRIAWQETIDFMRTNTSIPLSIAQRRP